MLGGAEEDFSVGVVMAYRRTRVQGGKSRVSDGGLHYNGFQRFVVVPIQDESVVESGKALSEGSAPQPC